MKVCLIVLTVIVSISSCDDSDSNGLGFGNRSYLPLEVGNYWEFAALGTQDQGIIEHREVVGKETIGDHVYYLVVSTWSVYSSRSTDSVYYRIADDGYVYKLRKDSIGEMQDIRLNAEDGDTWSYTYLGYETMITCSEVEIELGSTSVPGCKSYLLDVLQWADEEYTIVLAPSLGFVKEFSNAWGGGKRLKKVRIDGGIRSF